jgi:hypothetical protein
MSAPGSRDPYALAFLAGGPMRAVDTAVVTLLEDGRLRATDTGELSTVRLRYAHPLEAAVLDAVGRRVRRSVHTVRFRCVADERVAAFADQLAEQGLVRRPRGLPVPRRQRTEWTTTAAGERLLREARTDPSGEIPLRVALDGLDALPDQQLRKRVFELPRGPRRTATGYLDLQPAIARMADGGRWAGGGTGDHWPG